MMEILVYRSQSFSKVSLIALNVLWMNDFLVKMDLCFSSIDLRKLI